MDDVYAEFGVNSPIPVAGNRDYTICIKRFCWSVTSENRSKVKIRRLRGSQMKLSYESIQ
jgi:hypothetical protein